jgi:hypothetical protein
MLVASIGVFTSVSTAPQFGVDALFVGVSFYALGGLITPGGGV